MSVRQTEKRLPATLASPNDLGQAVADPNGALVSFLSSPIVAERIQHYAVFPTGAAVAGYRWTMTNGATTDVQDTSIGYLEYTPAQLGTLTVAVELRDAGSTTLATLTLQQTVLPLNAQLEQLVDQDERNVPAAAHPATSREMINDLRVYIDAIAPPNAENRLNRLLLSLAYTAALATDQVRRHSQLEGQAALLNGGRHADLLQRTEDGIGTCKVRPQVLAMFLPKPGGGANTYIPVTDKPGAARQRNAAITTIRTAFNGLTEDEKTDLFNTLRFPKANAAMALLVLTGLRDRFFSGEAFDKILSDRTKARLLITHYETGPWAPSAGASMSPTRGSQRVFNLMSHRIWAVLPAGATGGVPGGPAAPPAGPVTVGAPEPVPTLTFVASPKEKDNGFIRSAFLYHETYGFNPVLVDSFEDLILRLSQQATPVDRLRIVSHFFLPPDNSLHLPNMNMAFFTGARSFTQFWHFRYGVSDEEGLKALTEIIHLPHITPGYLSNPVTLPFDPAKPAAREPTWKVVIRGLRATAPAVLKPFKLDTRWPTAGDMANLVKRCTDLFFLDNVDLSLADDPDHPTVTLTSATAATRVAAVKDTVVAYIQGQIDQLKPRLVSSARTAAEVDALANAIATFAIGNLPVPLPTLGPFTLTFGDPVYLQDHAQFRQNLNGVRARLSGSSFVDIRGCRVGQDPPFMTALKGFFGGGAVAQPTVTAPEWFQTFPMLGFLSVPSEAQADGVFNGGFTISFTPASGPPTSIRMNGPDVQREYSTWAGRVGIPAQIAFWNQVFQGDALEFLTLRWKDHLPAIGMEAEKLDGLSALGYLDMMARVKEVFGIPPGSAPTNGVSQTFDTGIFPQVAALRDVETAVAALGSGATGTALQDQLALLQPIATAWGQTLPPASTPPTLAEVQQAIGQLKQHALTQSQTQNLIQAVKTKLADPKAGFRYMLFIGLPVLVQSGAQEPGVALVMLDALKDGALRSWTKIQWAWSGPAAVPPGLNNLTFTWNPPKTVIENDPTTRNDDDFTDLGRGLQVAALGNDRRDTVFAVNPTYEYQQHIISR